MIRALSLLLSLLLIINLCAFNVGVVVNFLRLTSPSCVDWPSNRISYVVPAFPLGCKAIGSLTSESGAFGWLFGPLEK